MTDPLFEGSVLANNNKETDYVIHTYWRRGYWMSAEKK